MSFFGLPLLGYCLLRLFASLARLARPSRDGEAYALILEGAALAFSGFFLFHRAPLLTGNPDLVRIEWLLPGIQDLSWSAVLFFSGYTITRLSGLLHNTLAGSPLYPAVLASGRTIMGYALWQAFASFSAYWGPCRGIGLVFLAGLLAAAASSLGEYGKYSRHPFLSDAAKWLNRRPVEKFFYGGLLAVYFLFIRPAIVAATPRAGLIEWLIVCLIAGRIFSAVRRSLDNNYSLPFQETAWQSHKQSIDELVSDDFERLVLLQEGFLSQSSRSDLVSSLRQTLKNNNLNEDEVHRMLAAITGYRDRKVPWYAFGFWKRRIRRQNRKNREQALKSTIDNMSNLVHSSRKTYEAQSALVGTPDRTGPYSGKGEPYEKRAADRN